MFKNLLTRSAISPSNRSFCKEIYSQLKYYYAADDACPHKLYYQIPGYYGPYKSLEEAQNDSTITSYGYATENVKKQHVSMITEFEERIITHDGLDPSNTREARLKENFCFLFNLFSGKSSFDEIKIVEFGGGIGIAAHLIAYWFPDIKFSWTIFEQPWLVDLMRVRNLNLSKYSHMISNLSLNYSSEPIFSSSWDSCDVFFTSAAIHYMGDWKSILLKAFDRSKFCFLDRFPISNKPEAFVANQVVAGSSLATIYPAIYFEKDWLTSIAEITSSKVELAWTVTEDHVFVSDINNWTVFDNFFLRGFIFSTHENWS